VKPDQQTHAIVHDAFLAYLEGKTSRSLDTEWKTFKSFLLRRMQAEATDRMKS
jgi:hypothetical protein